MVRFTWLRSKIKNKIFFTYSSLFIVAITISSWIWYGTASSMLRNNINDSLSYSMDTSMNSAVLLLSDLDHIITSLILLDGIGDILKNPYQPPQYEWYLDYKEIMSHLNLMKGYKREISGIALIDGMGNLYESGHISVASGLRADLASPWINRIKSNGGDITFQIRQDAGGAKTLSGGRAILSPEGIIGYAVIEVDYGQVEKIFQISGNDAWTMNVQDGDGQIIFSSNYDVSGDFSRENGDRWVMVQKTSEDYGWTYDIIIPQKVFFREIINLRRRTLGFVLAMLILILISSQIIAKGMTSNIITLDRAMKRVREGELDTVTDIDSIDEIGMMNRSFQEMMDRLRSLMEDIREREIKKKESEIEILQMQINPHFIYNTLNTINFLAKRNGQHEISEITVSFIELLRGSISNQETMVPLSRELEYIDSYMNIQRHKFRDEFLFVKRVDSGLLGFSILKMLLQPIVENALIHGILPMERRGTIELSITVESGMFLIQIRDDGEGFSELVREKKMNSKGTGRYQHYSGIGLANTEKRIKLYYGEQYGISFSGKPGEGTVVHLNLPLCEGEKDV